MKTFEVTFQNGERQIHEATYYRETTEAGTKVLELYKTVSNYDSQSKPYLYITGYLEVKELSCCNSCGNGQECESKEVDYSKLFEKDELGRYINIPKNEDLYKE